MTSVTKAAVLAVSFCGATSSATPVFAADGANSPDAASSAAAPSVSLAVERLGGLSYVSASSNNISVSAMAIGASPNPYGLPRVGIDYIMRSGITIGGGLGFGTASSTS